MAWSEDARQRARERCLANQPWLRSTGPRTLEGKAVVSLNALKHGLRCQHRTTRLLGRLLLIEQQAEADRAAMREWLVDAIALKKSNPRFYEVLADFANQSENKQIS